MAAVALEPNVEPTVKKTFTSYGGTIVREYKSNVARDATPEEIPIISMDSPKEKLLADLEFACTKVGFFYLKDHGVTEEASEDLFAAAKQFFALPEEVKLKYDIRKTKHLRGYEGFDINHVEKDLKPDINEQYNWGYEPDLDLDVDQNSHSEISWNPKNPMFGENNWTEEINMKIKVRAYYGQVLRLARKLATCFAQILDLPENFFNEALKQPGSMGRVIRYPPQSPSERALGIGAHTDIECFTILKTDDVPALQILNEQGEWLNAPPIKGAFVVNIGDMLARWTNDKFMSTIHRVLNITGKERYSIPVFIGPHYDTVIEPLENCNENHDSPYKAILAGEYVITRLKKDRLVDLKS